MGDEAGMSGGTPATGPAGETLMAARIRAFDWSATPMGPRERWPPALAALVELMLAAPQMATLAVGPERVFLYNDEAARHYGARHPGVLGQPLAEAFAHEFQDVAPFYDRVFAGEGVHVPAQSLDPAAIAQPEVFDAHLTPVRDGGGTVIAAYMTGTAIGPRLRAEASLRESGEAGRLALERKVGERTAELQASRDLLRGMINASTDMIQVFEAVRDASGAIVDFVWVLNNKTSEDRFGEVRGERLLQRNPGVVVEGVFDAFRRVTETGVPEQAERHYRHEQFDGWFYQSVVKLGDGVATTTKSIDDWKAAQADILRLQEDAARAALRESQERLRQFGEASQDILWIRDAETLQWVYLTPAFEAIYGLRREEALAGDNYRNWRDLVLPEDRDHAMASIARVRAGEWVTFEYRVRRPSDGTIRWLRDTDFPITDEAGRVVLIGGIGHDFTEVREAELRFQTLVEGMPQLVWRAVRDGEWTWASPQWSDYTGQSEAEYEGLGWLDALHPDDVAEAGRAWALAIQQGGFDVEYRIRRRRDGVYHWFQTRAVPVRDRAGTIVEWIGTSTDIDDLRALQERQRVLVAELQHRTRNLIGVVWSMADKTARASFDLPDFRNRFRGRLQALSRVQSLLSRIDDHRRVTFDELVGAEITAMNGSAERVTLDGPGGIRLRSSSVQTLAMALHELATNAVKYGALSQASGRLAIRWRLEPSAEDGKPWLHIEWRESGVAMPPPDAAPGGTGQGRELIERALPYQLNAKTSYVFEPDGVRCTIAIPASASATEADGNG